MPHKERNKEKDSSKSETNTYHTLVKKSFTPGGYFPTSHFLMLVAVGYSFSDNLKIHFKKQISDKNLYNVSDFKRKNIQRIRF